MCPIDVVVLVLQGYLGKYAPAGLNFVDFVKPSCPWIHGRLNINDLHLLCPTHLHLLLSFRNILKPKGFILNKNQMFLWWSAS